MSKPDPTTITRRPGPTVRTRVSEHALAGQRKKIGPVGHRGAVGDPAGRQPLARSGRLGHDAHPGHDFELAQKAVASGIGALVAVGAPTSLSVRLATELGVALSGFTDPSRCVQYA